MSKPRSLAAVFLVLATLAATACARDCTPRVEDGWLRLPPGSMPMLAGFGRIENACPAPLVIVGARSSAFGDVSLHETRLVDGVSRMRAVPALTVPADGAAVLEPGALHLMLMEPRAPVQAGDTVTVEFELQDGRTLRGEFPVRGAGG